MVKHFFEIFILVGSVILFFACDRENINVGPLNNCPRDIFVIRLISIQVPIALFIILARKLLIQ